MQVFAIATMAKHLLEGPSLSLRCRNCKLWYISLCGSKLTGASGTRPERSLNKSATYEAWDHCGKYSHACVMHEGTCGVVVVTSQVAYSQNHVCICKCRHSAAQEGSLKVGNDHSSIWSCDIRVEGCASRASTVGGASKWRLSDN